MASTISKKVFDSEEASAMVKDLRVTFGSGKTRSYEWRASQLKALIKLTEQHEQEIVRALYSDQSKSETESFVQEGEKKDDIKNKLHYINTDCEEGQRNE